MTNWVDLIDTDPVGAYQAMIKESDAVGDLGIWVIDYPDNFWRLMANLAALCEKLSEIAAMRAPSNGTFGSEWERHQAWNELHPQEDQTTKDFPDGGPR